MPLVVAVIVLLLGLAPLLVVPGERRFTLAICMAAVLLAGLVYVAGRLVL